jgi:hypothetical protein
LYCRYLHPDHPWRVDAKNEFESQEFGPTPAPRTRIESMQQALEAEEYYGADDNHPAKAHGIRGTCPLSLLPFFNIIWDLCPDLMHINKNLWDRCIVAMFLGKRNPKLGKKNVHPGRYRDQLKKRAAKKQKVDEAELRALHWEKVAVYNKEHQRYLNALARAKEWTLTKKCKVAFDKRVRAMAGSGLIPFSTVPCDTIPGRKTPKSATWISFLRSCVPYAMAGVPLIVRTSIVGLCGILSKVLLATCDYIPGDEEATAAAKLKTKELKYELICALCIFERDAPESELSYFLHEIVHLCDFLYRWNNVRNYWCFLVERFVGYVKGFVTNRHLVLESLVSSLRSFPYIFNLYPPHCSLTIH